MMFIIQRDGFTVHGLEFQTLAEAQAYYNANAKVLQATASYQVNIVEIDEYGTACGQLYTP
mgnify:CR=1 FL=1